MPDKTTGFIVSRDSDVIENMTDALSPSIEIVGKNGDSVAAYNAIIAKRPEAVFIDLRHDWETALGLCRRLRRALPGVPVFLIAKEKDPDLILEGFRVGAADYVVFPGSEGDLLGSVKRSLGRGNGKVAEGDVCAVFSPKGGQGVTTLAVNLADHIRKISSEKVILADLNLYIGNVTNYLDTPCTYTPFDLVSDIDRIDDNLLFSSLNQHDRGFFVLGISGEVYDANQLSGEDVSRMIRELKAHADYVLLDLPHEFSPRTLAALESADSVLLVVQQDVQSIKTAQRAIGVFQGLGFSSDKAKIVVNRFTGRDDISIDDLNRVLKRPVYAIVSNDHRALSMAHEKGQTLDSIAGSSGLNKEIAALGGRIAGIGSDSREPGVLKSLFGLRAQK